MAKVGIRQQGGELRLIENIDSSDIKEDFIVFEDEEDTLFCGKTILLPSTLVIERGNIKSVKFIREATSTDKLQLLNKKNEERKAFNICNSKIEIHDLPMRLIDAVYTFDFNRLTFFFSAESRVDFRKLLKDLTASFRRTRIILRQIGAREEARLFNGVGTCGKVLCCSSWLVEFPFVTMKMAKNQNLPPNPGKLTGACGKLKCCLSYEDNLYVEEKSKMPVIGSFIETMVGIAQVIKHYPFNASINIKYYESGNFEDIRISEIKNFNVQSPAKFEEEFSELDEI